MRRLLLALGFILLLVALPFLSQLPDRVIAHMPKKGVVIDSETGQPMPNVIVIAAGWAFQGPIFFGPSGTINVYRIITYTDSEGRFRIPSTWSGLRWGFPGTDHHYRWAVTAFKPGYAIVGDEIAWQFREDGSIRSSPPSTVLPPKHSFWGLFVEIEPIQMFKPTLNLKEAAVYYSRIRYFAPPPLPPLGPEDEALRQQGYSLLAPWVCAIDPQERLDKETLSGVRSFAADRSRVSALLEELDPLQAHMEIYQHPMFKAETICKIITNGTGVP